MKYISFSLFGRDPNYTLGAVANSQNSKFFYPGWTPVFYVSPEIETEIIDQLLASGSIVIQSGPMLSKNPRIWRFAAALLPKAEYTIFRDTDSRFSTREVEAVDQWLNTKHQLHIIRDHPRHYYPIMAGMWGVRSTESMQNSIKEVLSSARGVEKPEDQTLLAKILYPRFKEDVFVHDAFYDREPNRGSLAKRNIDGSFIGEQIDFEGKPNLYHRKIVDLYERTPFQKLRLRYFDKLRQIVYQFTRVNLYLLLKSGKTERS